MPNSASHPQWPMDDEGEDEVGNLFLLLRKFLKEPPVLLRLQCHVVQIQQMDVNAEIILGTKMNLRYHTMNGTAGGVGPLIAAFWLFQFDS